MIQQLICKLRIRFLCCITNYVMKYHKSKFTLLFINLIFILIEKTYYVQSDICDV